MTVVARVARCAIGRLRLVKGEKYASRARPACGFAYKRKRQTKRMDEVFVAQVAGVRSATR